MLVDPDSLAVLGGGIALGGGLLGSAIGIARAASAGVATLSEEPGQFRNVVVLASLPMTQSFYGLIVLILIINSIIITFNPICSLSYSPSHLYISSIT